MIPDEILFYGGIGIAVFAVILAVMFLIVFHIEKIKLNLRFDEEYGKKPQKKTVND